jgi:hypothetical protein
MNLFKAEQFLSDAQYYYRWYLTLPDLERDAATELADEFLESVEQTLLYLVSNPLAGRPRCVRFSDLQGFRSWRVSRPFNRFAIFYRIEQDNLFAERLLEGHRLLAADRNPPA